MASHFWTKLVVFMTAVTAFISFFLIGFSFDTLEPNVMALMFDQNTGYLDCSQVYGVATDSSRRWFTGLGRGFYTYRFNSTSRNMVFGSTPGADAPIIDARTQDGASIVVSLALQYRLPQDGPSLCNLYYTYGQSYHSFYVHYARSATRDTMALFQVTDLWNNRSGVSDVLETKLRPALKLGGASLVNFQMMSLDIPDALQAAIENTTVAAQKIEQASLQLNAAVVAANTTRLQAERQGALTLTMALANANVTTTLANSTATVLQRTTAAEANGYAAMKTSLGLNTTNLLALRYMDALTTSTAQNVLLSAADPFKM